MVLALLQVTVLESRNRIGGRVWDDDKSLGCCVGRGAQILNGCINNPVSVLCEQVGAGSYPKIEHCVCVSWKHVSHKMVNA